MNLGKQGREEVLAGGPLQMNLCLPCLLPGTDRRAAPARTGSRRRGGEGDRASRAAPLGIFHTRQEWTEQLVSRGITSLYKDLREADSSSNKIWNLRDLKRTQNDFYLKQNLWVHGDRGGKRRGEWLTLFRKMTEQFFPFQSVFFCLFVEFSSASRYNILEECMNIPIHIPSLQLLTQRIITNEKQKQMTKNEIYSVSQKIKAQKNFTLFWTDSTRTLVST